MRRGIRAAAVPVHRHSLPQIAVDAALIALAYFLAFQLRFDHGPAGRYALLRNATLPWVALGGVAVLAIGRVYERRWRYSGQRDYVALLRGIVAVTVLTVLCVAVLRPVVVQGAHRTTVGVTLPNGVDVLFLLLSGAFLMSARMAARAFHERRPLAGLRTPGKNARSVLIVGAGDGGQLVLREIHRNRELGLMPVGFLDDDPRKHGLRIDGVRVRGDTKGDLARILDEAEPDEVIIAIPSAPGSTRARIVRECRARAVQVRTLPTVFELLRDQDPARPSGAARAGALAHQVREVRVEDVLGREPVHVELSDAGGYLAGEVVLVTGAGGSIGAELCRQIVQVRPRRLVLLDHAEDNLFAIARELEEERHVPPAALAPVLADCKRSRRMAEVFARHRPTVVFHAAAYKHVGLMETNPVEAVRNNALASRLMAMLAGDHGTERFVLVSTDKAVQPATVMGASKALAELALQAAAAQHPDTRYATVRFGNVLGSSGSVVPIFARQIERGGPVTVTDERMERYFMTIPEAVQLIIRAGSLAAPGRGGAALGGRSPEVAAGGVGSSPAPAAGGGYFSAQVGEHAPSAGAPTPVSVPAPPAGPHASGDTSASPVPAAPAAPSGAELYVLDMGEPVKIVDLARAMIELSGLQPGRDIEIEVVGARPGEKLSEQLCSPAERPVPTEAEKLLRIEREPLPVPEIEEIFAEIQERLAAEDPTALADWLAGRIVSRLSGGAPAGALSFSPDDARRAAETAAAAAQDLPASALAELGGGMPAAVAGEGVGGPSADRQPATVRLPPT